MPDKTASSFIASKLAICMFTARKIQAPLFASSGNISISAMLIPVPS
jgi:hypothetical protein